MKNWKKIKRKAHNFILKSITFVAAILLMLSICAMDSESQIPSFICLASSMWLAIFIYANSDDEEGGDVDGMD